MIERPREEQLVHFYAREVRGLMCRFVGAHIVWTVDARAVDCPKCRQQLMSWNGEREQQAANSS